MSKVEYICTLHSSYNCELRGYTGRDCRAPERAPKVECKFMVSALPQEPEPEKTEQI